MKKASVVVSKFYQGNKLFDLQDPVANRDNCLYAFHKLKEALAKRGYDLQTDDIHWPEDSDIVLYNEMPKRLPTAAEKSKSYLMIFESELIRPDNWDLERHTAFKKIFTWNDKCVDNERYFKFNFSHLFPEQIGRDSGSPEKLCTLIAGNKTSDHPLELYSKRVDTIRWFEKNAPESFDYYGFGWERPYLTNPRIARALRKLGALDLLPARYTACYRGAVRSKFETLGNYKFSICYENARDIPGYITEKIFDCFFAGCVPVYWGANNIAEHIPSDCYIDRRQFKDHTELYRFLCDMSEPERLVYVEAIKRFLEGERALPFTANHFAETIAQQIADG